MDIGGQRTLSRVPVAIRGIALTTPEIMVDLNDGLKVELRCEKSAIASRNLVLGLWP